MPTIARAILSLWVVCSPAAVWGQAAPALPTKLEVKGDTIFARVTGNVPLARTHRLVQQLSIAPGLDDTTLFTQVNSFTVDGTGRLWVFDQPTATLFLFDQSGALLKRIGRRGGGPGEFQTDNGSAALPGGRFAIWDARNTRISWFAPDATFERSTIVSKGFYTFGGLVVDRRGGVFIKHPVSRDRTNGIGTLGLIRLGPDGALGDSLLPPDVNVPETGYTATRDEGRARATYQSRNAALASWVWHADGYFVTVDGLRSRLVLSRRTAKPVVIERRLDPVRVSTDERADDEAFITWGLRQTVPTWKWTGSAVPDTKPSLGASLAARDGRLWVRVATPSERIPEAELPVRRPNGPPPYRFRSPIEWEVYGSDGVFLARIAFPRDVALVQADGDTVWALGRDEDDLPAVRRYRIEPPLPRARP